MKYRKKESMKKEAAISYIRVSTVEQSQEGVSLAAQTEVVRSYAKFRGFELVGEISDEAISASIPLFERPGGLELLEYLTQGKAKAVIAFKLDRLFRDAGDCLTVTKRWDKRGISLHLVNLGGQVVDTSSAMGRFFLTVMAGVAEMERNLISERTQVAMAHLKSQNRRIGNVPYGKSLAKDGLHLVENLEEQATIELAIKLNEEGKSLRAIAKALKAEGIVSRKGQQFHSEQIRRMLQIKS